MKKINTLLCASLLLSACASTPLLTDRDVVTAENRGQLNKLYQDIHHDLENSKPSSELAQNRQQFLPIVGRKIAEQKEREILARLEHDFAKHDVATLETELKNTTEIEQYNREIYLELTMQLQKAIDDKERNVREKQFQFQQLDDNRAIEKVQLLNEIAEIYGGEKQQVTQQELQAYIDSLFASAEQALTAKRNEDVRGYLNSLQIIAPADERLVQVKHSLIIVENEQAFWDALSKGQTDKAFETYQLLTTIPDYIEKHVDVVPVAEDMIRFFVAAGNKSMSSFAIAAAYQSYTKANYIKESLNQEKTFADGETKFIDHIASKIKTTVAQKQWAAAYGLSLILQEFQPTHDVLQEYGAQINQAVLDEATFKLQVKNFVSLEQGSSLGAKVSQEIKQQVDVASNKDIINISDDETPANSAGVYWLSGEVLAAKVSQTTANIEETQNVLVSNQKVENPEYVTWSKLTAREKKYTPEPEAIIEVPVHEDVVLHKTRLEKTVVMSLSYRLTDAKTGRVVFADAINREMQKQADQIQGVKRGLFVQEAQQAELPDNVTLLEQVTAEIAQQIAKNVVEQSAALQPKYVKLGDQAVVAEHFNNATNYYAFGYIMKQAQHQADDDLLEKLKTYAIRWK